MIHYYSQRDPRWNRLTLPHTGLSLHNWGCTLTSIANMVQVALGVGVTPGVCRDQLSFNSLGEVYWYSVQKIDFHDVHLNMKEKGMLNVPENFLKNFTGRMIFKGRYFGNLTKTDKLLVNHPDYFFLIRLNQSPPHWVLLNKWTVKYLPWFSCIDPFTFNNKRDIALVRTKFKHKIDGYAVFKRERR